MRILLLATKDQRDELVRQGVSGNISFEWKERIDQLPVFLPDDILLDLIYNESSEHEKWLESISAGTIIINSVTKPVSQRPWVRINGWNGFLGRPIVEAATKNKKVCEAVEAVFAQLNKTVEWLPDEVGFIAPRVIAAIINEAYFALEEGVSSKSEIDIAMKLGTNYPYGPFEWCEKIGAANIVSLLNNLAAQFPRYQPAKLLTEEAKR